MDVADVSVDLRQGHVDAAIRYGFGQPAGLLRATLLHEAGMPAGLARRRVPRGPVAVTVRWRRKRAIRGEGMALARSTWVVDDMALGRLVAPFPVLRLNAERGCDLVPRPGAQDHPKIVALRRWLRAEIEAFPVMPG